jgi:hypothetical protein
VQAAAQDSEARYGDLVLLMRRIHLTPRQEAELYHHVQRYADARARFSLLLEREAA